MPPYLAAEWEQLQAFFLDSIFVIKWQDVQLLYKFASA